MVRRRQILASGALVALAGCSSINGEEAATTGNGSETATERRGGVEATVSDTPGETETRAPDRLDIAGEGETEAMRPDLFSARIAWWAYVGSVRYYSPEANALKTVEAENDALYSIRLGIRNHTDTTTSDIPVPSDFELYVGKETYSAIDELPGGVQWSQLRQRPNKIDIDPPDGHYSDEMDGGVDGYIDVVFDAPVMDSFAVKWNWSTGGESGMKWLLPPK